MQNSYKGAGHMLASIEESQTLAIAKRVRELQRQGKDIISLTLGEPDFDTPDYIREAAIRAIRDGHTHYTPVAGLPELREAIAHKFKIENNIDTTSANVIVSNGAKQSLFNVFMTLLAPGDEVILPSPYWVSYLPMIQLAGAQPVIVSCTADSQYKITPSLLEKHIGPATKAIIINSPSNPTGMVYREEELRSLAEFLQNYPNVWIISDEIYEHIVYSGPCFSVGSFDNVKDRTITINGMSKGFAMTGWRIGYATAPLSQALLLEKYQGQVTSGASSISQHAALAALTVPPTHMEDMLREYLNRRNFVYGYLAQNIPFCKAIMPDGAFYFFPDFTYYLSKLGHDTNSDALVNYLINNAGVATVSGTAFGDDRCIRLSCSYSTSVLEEGLSRMAKQLCQL